MSLQYIIDAYNLINHPAFKPANRHAVNIQSALADFISSNRLAGSKNNRVILVFDGYPPNGEDIPSADNLKSMFSNGREADALIRDLVESSPSPGSIIVVSDDKEVRISSRLLQAGVCGVEEFIRGKDNHKDPAGGKRVDEKPDLGFSQMQKINAELKKKWLGEGK